MENRSSFKMKKLNEISDLQASELSNNINLKISKKKDNKKKGKSK